jgi:acyl-CoA thioester hydrolase
MPLTHVRTFRVRHYECDAFGHVNNANYLRFMQESAIDASAAAGYDRARYAEMDRLWLVRETDIKYLRPLRYGDSVQIKTWVADFRRVRSRRAYEFRHTGSGDLVARALTDWIFLDSTTGRPTAMPPEMMHAFFPEGPPQSAPPRTRFPSPPPPPPGVYRMRRRVEWRDLDDTQHVNNAAYLAYFEDCGLQVCAAHGWPLARMQEAGFAIVARRQRIEYRQPALFDDELELTTWASDMKHTSALRHFAIARVGDGAPVAQARTRWVWVNLETGRPIRIPEPFLADFAPNIAGAPTSARTAQGRSRYE